MESNSNIGACQPKILSEKNKNHFEYAGASGGYIDFLGYPYCRGRIFNTIEKDYGQYNEEKEIFWTWLFNMGSSYFFIFCSLVFFIR